EDARVAPDEVHAERQDREREVFAEEVQIVVRNESERVRQGQSHDEHGAEDPDPEELGIPLPRGRRRDRHAVSVAARPRCGKSPAERHWRNQITIRSTATSAYTAAATPPVPRAMSL